jgi:hypothetical protein
MEKKQGHVFHGSFKFDERATSRHSDMTSDGVGKITTGINS